MGKIVFPHDIYGRSPLKELTLTVYYKNKTTVFNLCPDNFRSFEINDEDFEECLRISLDASYQDSNIAPPKHWNPSKMFWKRGMLKLNQQSWLRKNSETPFSDSEEDIQKILSLLEEKKQEAAQCSSEKRGNKSLIYYAVGGKMEYFDFLQWSVESILKHFDGSFELDFLFFCPKSWIEKIQKLNNGSINFYYEIIPDTQDGVEIAMHRLRIFDFSLINNYRKILYLDSDIICFNSIKALFDLDLTSETFYAVKNCGNYKTFNPPFFTHTIVSFDKDTLSKLQENGQVPLNTGQFLFLNTQKMEKHFDNIRWLHSVWPLEYFFEQCFFNHYFCTLYLSNTSLLENKIVLQQNRSSLISEICNTATLIHFVGPPLDGETKKEYITEQLYALAAQ